MHDDIAEKYRPALPDIVEINKEGDTYNDVNIIKIRNENEMLKRRIVFLKLSNMLLRRLL